MSRHIIVRSEALSTPIVSRYIIINNETKEVLSDAQGHGYRSVDSAERAWSGYVRYSLHCLDVE